MTLPKTGSLSEMNPAIEGHDPEMSVYSLYLHLRNWHESVVFRRSMEYQNPLKSVVTGETTQPYLPDHMTLLNIRPSNIVLSSVFYEDKKAY